MNPQRREPRPPGRAEAEELDIPPQFLDFADRHGLPSLYQLW